MPKCMVSPELFRINSAHLRRDSSFRSQSVKEHGDDDGDNSAMQQPQNQQQPHSDADDDDDGKEASWALLGVCDKTQFASDMLLRFVTSFGEPLFARGKQDVAKYLRTIVEYAESDKASAKTRRRLRFIGQLLIASAADAADDLDAASILAHLASHGGVCHIQKEVGISTLYAMVTNSRDVIEAQSLERRLYRLLTQLRETLVERMHTEFVVRMKRKQKSSSGAMRRPPRRPGRNADQSARHRHREAVNEVHMTWLESRAVLSTDTHALMGFRNGLAPYVGLSIMHDEHAILNVPTQERVNEFFRDYYNREAILKCVCAAINESPRKIPYSAVVDCLERQLYPKIRLQFPQLSKYDFFTACFDADNGHVSTRCVCLILEHFDILKQAPAGVPVAPRMQQQSRQMAGGNTSNDGDKDSDGAKAAEKLVSDLRQAQPMPGVPPAPTAPSEVSAVAAAFSKASAAWALHRNDAEPDDDELVRIDKRIQEQQKRQQNNQLRQQLMQRSSLDRRALLRQASSLRKVERTVVRRNVAVRSYTKTAITKQAAVVRKPKKLPKDAKRSSLLRDVLRAARKRFSFAAAAATAGSSSSSASTSKQ
eukprot:TRINITY_DN66815_c6_g15_i1.p1 TRINITY_DN66815_c6_g15~~TRINITY_DN66815_c6_g15_i1.p1  ORF type:complete len:650 (+),score=352.98 TRINITY_DN66815_c6_g15_i1:166-1950(+)